MTARPNIIIVMSDQHSRDIMGCAGNGYAETPHLDALAARGTRFSRAYCNAPICVPSRASLATGLPIHEIPAWDNADPYHGQRTSFMHRARQAGYLTASIGKLHFRSTEDDNGFDEEVLPMHVASGTGSLTSLIRDELPRVKSVSDLIRNAGPGISSYTRYDNAIREHAIDWISGRAREAEAPFLLFVSFTNPHPPYEAPPDLFDRFRGKAIPLPERHGRGTRPEHPALDGFRRYFDLEDPFSDDVLAAATAAYYANVCAIDGHVGAVLQAVEAAGLTDRCVVIYTSDHGESLGRKGLFGKCNMFEESIGVPLIMAGPGVPQNRISATPVQLLDLYPTVVDIVDAAPTAGDRLRPSRSLRALAQRGDHPRKILVQHHSAGTRSAQAALTNGRTKLVRSLDGPSMLFDLLDDPDESTDLAADPAYAPVLELMETRLAALIDLEQSDRDCKASQHRRLAAAGGPSAVLARGNAGYSAPPESTVSKDAR